MDGGMTPEERQRQTAAEIARKKVVAAYSNSQPQTSTYSTQSYKSSAPAMNPGSAEQNWQKYHTAWQNYYQKYYSEYYAGAAQKVVESEKSRLAQANQQYVENERARLLRESEQRMEAERARLAEEQQSYVESERARLDQEKQAYVTAERARFDQEKQEYMTAERARLAEENQAFVASEKARLEKQAKEYVEGERSKLQAESEKQTRAMQQLLQQRAEQQDRMLNQAVHQTKVDPEQSVITSVATEEEQKQEQKVADKLRSVVRERADSKFTIKKRHRKFIPILAGVFVVLFVLFLQYNRLVFAPVMAYISPGNATDEEITAIDPTVTDIPTGENKLIIPKLNVNVPVHFGIANDAGSIDMAMLNGVAHYRIPGASAFPGEIGRVVITGHSAGDIYSNNQYKFIFSGLERMVEGDLIYINFNGVRYTYKVTGHRTVEPTDVNALVYDGGKPVLMLLTCWPTGTDRYRYLLEAEQINPAVNGNEAVSENIAPEDEQKTEEMPKNEKTFFEKVWDFLTGNR